MSPSFWTWSEVSCPLEHLNKVLWPHPPFLCTCPSQINGTSKLNLGSHQCLQMALRMREWLKRQRELNQLLCYSDSDDGNCGIKKKCDRAPGTLNSCSSDNVPGIPHSFISDTVPGTSDIFDFDTDVDYWSTDSEKKPNDEAEVTSSFEDDLRQWALEHKLTHRALNYRPAVLDKEICCRGIKGGDIV